MYTTYYYRYIRHNNIRFFLERIFIFLTFLFYRSSYFSHYICIVYTTYFIRRSMRSIGTCIIDIILLTTFVKLFFFQTDSSKSNIFSQLGYISYNNNNMTYITCSITFIICWHLRFFRNTIIEIVSWQNNYNRTSNG